MAIKTCSPFGLILKIVLNMSINGEITTELIFWPIEGSLFSLDSMILGVSLIIKIKYKTANRSHANFSPKLAYLSMLFAMIGDTSAPVILAINSKPSYLAKVTALFSGVVVFAP